MTTIDPRAYQMLVVAKALELYAKTGIKANRAYTPARMMQTASQLTGRTFKARDYVGAAAALREKVQALSQLPLL